MPPVPSLSRFQNKRAMPNVDRLDRNRLSRSELGDVSSVVDDDRLVDATLSPDACGCNNDGDKLGPCD
jgi:hypothetical protein